MCYFRFHKAYPVLVDPRLESRARTPRYTFPAAAGLVGRPTNTVRRWSTGNSRKFRGATILDPPLIKKDGTPPGPPLSFLNLLELQMLARYRDEAALQAIRPALEYAAQELDVARPLLSVQFRVHGGELFTRYAHQHGGRILVNATRGGQVALDEVVAEATQDIEYELETAHRWWPKGKDVPIFVDSRVAAARPVTARSAVSLVAIETRIAEGLSMQAIADDTGAELEEIEAAATFLAA